MTHFRKQNKIHAGQTTVSHNQHDTLSNKHNINVNCDSLFAKTATNSLLPTSHIKRKKSIKMLPTNRDTQSMTYIKLSNHNPCNNTPKKSWYTWYTTHAKHQANRSQSLQQTQHLKCQTQSICHSKRHKIHAKQERCTIHDITSQSMRLRVTMMNNPRHKSIKQHHNPCNNTARKHENQSTTYTKQQIRSMQQHVTQRPRKHDTQSMTHTHTKRQIAIHVTTWQPRNHDKQSMTYTKQQITIHDAHQATYHNACNNMAAKKPG